MNPEVFISFNKNDGGYEGSLNIGDFMAFNKDPEHICHQGSMIYQESIDRIKKILTERDQYLDHRKKIPARLVWRVGNEIFHLNELLAEHDLIIDNTYAHLERDLVVKRKWLEKVVILRRYVKDVELIPEDSSWGWFEKGTKKKIQELLKGDGVN